MKNASFKLKACYWMTGLILLQRYVTHTVCVTQSRIFNSINIQNELTKLTDQCYKLRQIKLSESWTEKRCLPFYHIFYFCLQVARFSGWSYIISVQGKPSGHQESHFHYFSMNFEKYISFTSTYKITKQKRELLPKHEQESAPKFPNIMVCNYQAHSRLLLKQNYPMMTMRRTLDLYKVTYLGI